MRLARVTGWVFLLLGLLGAGFIAYQFFWTDHQAASASSQTIKQLEKHWARSSPSAVPEPAKGKAFAIIRIPRLGSNWQQPVIEGIDSPELARGVGHYPFTSMPGEIGNFAVAGHRVTHGHPFRELDRMEPGDLIGITMGQKVYVYRTVARHIVTPKSVEVLAPVPFELDAQPTVASMIISTCHPKFSARQRMVLVAQLQSTYPLEMAPAQLRPRP